MRKDAEQLVRQIRQGDELALADFIDLRRAEILKRIELGMSGPLRRRIDAEDILQEVSVECVRNLGQTDFSGRDVLQWIYHVARLRVIDAHRRLVAAQKRSAQREVPLQARADRSAALADILAASLTTPSQALSRKIRIHRLSQALAALPEDHQEALQMRYVDGMRANQIAEHLGKTSGATRLLLMRALRRLEELMTSSESQS